MEKRLNVLSFFSILSAGVLLISNICATKIFSLGSFPFDGGLLLFPLSYVLGDLVVELYGEKIARSVIFAGFSLNIIAVVSFYLVEKLPAYPGWENQEAFEAILGFTPRIIAGSLVAYVVSSLLNNLIFEKIRCSQTEECQSRKFYVRALGSSVFAHLIDTVIFETIAFFGVLSFRDFVLQAVFAYAAGLFLETCLCPITSVVAKHFRTRIN